MHKRSIRALSFLVGLGLVALGLTAYAAARVREAAEQAERDRLCALTDAVIHLEAMADGLSLAVAADAPLPALLSLRHDADLAAAALSRFPFAGEGGEALRRFAVSTAEVSGIAADALARSSSARPDYPLLIRLRDFARPLADRILPAAVNLDSGTVDESALAAHFSGLGRLYYDGIASDVIHPGGYLCLMKGTPIDVRRARSIAAGVIGGSVRLACNEIDADPARYCFSGANLTINISAVDGHLLTLLYDRRHGQGSAADAALHEAAIAAINSYAPETMTLVATDEGEACRYFTFAPTREGVLCMSEAVIVGIDRASAKLTLWDADRYYRYHIDTRTLPAAMLTPEEAALAYGSTDTPILCTALRPDGRELLCYRLGEGERAVYLNAVTGRVERAS